MLKRLIRAQLIAVICTLSLFRVCWATEPKTEAISQTESKQLIRASGRNLLNKIKTIEPSQLPVDPTAIAVTTDPRDSVGDRKPAAQSPANSQLRNQVQINRRQIEDAKRRWSKAHKQTVSSQAPVVVNCTTSKPKLLADALGSNVKIIDAWDENLGDLNAESESIVLVHDAQSQPKTNPWTGRPQTSNIRQPAQYLPPLCAHGKSVFAEVQFNSNSGRIESTP